MSNCVIPTQLLKKEIASSFFEYFTENTENNWFLAIGNPIPWVYNREEINSPNIILGPRFSNASSEDEFIPTNLDTEKDKFEFYRTCTAMKKLTFNDVSFIIRKNTWKANSVYQPYRHDEEMFVENKNFYIYNQENKCVYKCIENSALGSSAGEGLTEGTSQYPPFSTNLGIIDTQDGYKWKLIYQLSSNDEIKFSLNGRTDLDSFIPVKYIDYDPDVSDDAGVLHKSVQDAAVNGSISSIYINPIYSKIFKYDENYCVVGNENAKYSNLDFSAGATTMTINYFGNIVEENSLRDMIFYVISGPGLGQVRPIKSSKRVSVSGTDYFEITIDPLDFGISGFFGDGENSSKINILPNISIFGDGKSNDPTSIGYSDLKTALAIPIFDSERNIRSVNILDQGRDYSFASAEITKGLTSSIEQISEIPKDFLGVSLSPFGGHGSNALLELGASNIVLKKKFTGNESNRINASNDFRQIAIIKNPKLSKPSAIVRTIDGFGGSVETGDAATLTGNGITAFATISRIKSYPSGAREFLLTGFSGNADNYDFITTENSAGSLPIDPFDGFDFLEIAGKEDTITRTITSTQNIPNTINPRDTLIGYGNKALGITPSLATGKVFEISTTNLKKITVENIQGVFKEGEIVRCFDRGGTFSGDFIIDEISDYSFAQTESVYNMTTKLYISPPESVSFLPNTFKADEIIYSFEDNEITDIGRLKNSSKYKKNGIVFDWKVKQTVDSFGLTSEGLLEVVGAKEGDFEQGDYILFVRNNIVSYAIINKVENPDIAYGSGEVLYVQNFAGIERYISSEEEINLVIGL